ncbi:gluconolaconase [Acidobacterium sp. S8]|uniref:Vgb family protein n=1 Tax=Acidobacterium sp. S8 TaxID=1641854 RepID=UPI0020B12433|nr:gluconolaconase [Acidobacterium sp. S8]
MSRWFRDMARIAKHEALDAPRIETVSPGAALPGGEVEIKGANLGPTPLRQPVAMLGQLATSVLLSRSACLKVRIPDEAESGDLQVLQNGAQSNAVKMLIAGMIATDVHIVANPAVDIEGNIYATLSGTRGQSTPVSVYRIGSDGEMRPFVTGIINATGMALDPEGFLYVSSRNDGTVFRVSPNGIYTQFAEGMGVATGLAFDAEQNLYVGDRSGTIFKIAPDRQIFVFATLEPSVAAYHLAFGRDETLYVTGPTTSSYDNVYAIDRDGNSTVFYRGLGRPQGLALDIAGNVYVAGSLHGRRGVARITPSGEASLAVAGSGIVGLSFAPGGDLILATNTAMYHLALGVEGQRPF